MNEEEARKALESRAKVICKMMGRVYIGKLMARVGEEFIFEGNDGSEKIRVWGKAELFSLKDGNKWERKTKNREGN